MNGPRRAPETRVALSLGSNQGAREETVLAAAERLSAVPGLVLEIMSSLYETSPVGIATNTPFINAACVARSALSPRELLDVCLRVEAEFGRRRGAEPRGTRAPEGSAADGGGGTEPRDRTLDIDIILYGETVVAEADLRIPHLRFQSRLFVLVPLVEICPGMKVPPSGRTVADVRRDSAGEGWVRLVSTRYEALNLLKTKKME